MPANSTVSSILLKAKDLFTGFLTFVSGDHRYIHEGKAFSVIGNTGSVAAAGSYTCSITTPPAVKGYVHLRPARVSASANLTSYTIIEGATVTGGTAAIPVNLNRNIKTKSNVTATVGVTISAAGTTTIYQDIIGTGGVVPASAGGASGSEHERVLKPETTYSITFTVIGATTASTAYFDIFWYEEKAGL